MKFGGTSVSNLQRWKQILTLVKLRQKQGHKVAVVHSAKSGVTNSLEKFTASQDKTLIDKVTDSIKQLSSDLSVSVNIDSFIDRLLKYSDKKTLTAYDTADILSMGELMTHAVGLAFLKKHINCISQNPKYIFISRQDDNRAEATKILSAKCSIKSIGCKYRK